METYVYIDSAIPARISDISTTPGVVSGTSNSYVYRLNNRLVGVYKAELLSAAFPQQSSCNHVVLDIVEFETPRNDGNFGVINNLVPVNSNIAYTSQSYYPIQACFNNPVDLDRLTVRWKDPTGNIITMGNNSLLLKISHLK